MKKSDILKIWRENSNKRAITSVISAFYLVIFMIIFLYYRVWELVIMEAVLASVLLLQAYLIKKLPPEKTMASVRVTPIVNTVHAVVSYLVVGPAFGVQFYLLGMDSATGGSLKDSKLYRGWFFFIRIADGALFVALHLLSYSGIIKPKHDITGVLPSTVYCIIVLVIVLRKALLEAANAFADVSFVETENREKEKAINDSAKKSEFISGISHELRTPVNAIVGMNKMILKESKDPVITGYAGEIEKAGNSLMDLLDQVTAFNGGRKHVQGKKSISFSADGARVLVVDDTTINLKLIGNYLKDTGLSLAFATNGEEALRICEKDKFDLLLLDSMMPHMNGEELLQKIRKEGKNVETPAVVVTADAVGNSREHYLEAGFCAFLAKPLEPDLLGEVMIKYLPSDKVKLND